MRKHSVMRSLPVAVLAAVCAGGILAARVGAESDGHADFKAAAAAAFAQADADGSGELSAAEFASFHEVLRGKIEALRFAKLDTDGDGGLSQAELAAGHHARGRGPHGPGCS